MPTERSSDHEIRAFPQMNQTSSPLELQRFRQAVATDLSLQKRLRETPDWESFIRLVVDLGREAGYLFTAADVAQALRAAQQDWLFRWID
jgi:hypothetical protein